MKKFRNIYTLAACITLAVGLFSACNDDLLSTQNNPNAAQTTADDAFPWQPGMAFIKLKASVNPSTRAATQSVTRAKVFNNTDVKVEQVFDMTNDYAELKRARGLDRWFVVKFDSTKNVEEVINELLRDPAIEKAHGNVQIAPNKVKYTSATRAPIPENRLRAANDGTGFLNFNDPYLKYQWHYTTTIPSYGMFKEGADVNLFPAWQKETGDPHVVVAVMDSGIDFEHEDLAASAWQGVDSKTGEKIHGRNFYAAESGKGSPNAYIVKAFEFAAENGASVCNCSWGYAFDRKKYLNNENFQAIFKKQFDMLKEGIDYFTDIAGCDSKGNKKPGSYMKGGLVIFASGNDSQYDIEMIPASYPRVVAVGATNSMGIPTDYMNKGPWVDILAPGGTTETGEVMRGVLSTVPKNFAQSKTGSTPNTDFILPNDGNYAYAQGTSMAAPHVSGIAALIVSKFGKTNPNFTNEDLRRRILGAVKATSPYAVKTDANLAGKMGVGFIDADFALSDPETQKPDAPQVTVTDYSTDATRGYYDARITWKVTADADALNPQHTAFAYDISLYKKADMSKAVQSFTRYSYDKPVGTELEQEFTGLDTDVDYVVKMSARDRFNNTSADATASFKTRLNHAPVLGGAMTDTLRLLDTQPYFHKVLPVTDEDGHTWTYTTTALPSGVEMKRVGNALDLFIKVGSVGSYGFEVTLTDQLGGKTVQKFAYKVVSHTAPKPANTLGDVSLFGQGEATQINLANAFTSMSGGEMQFSASSSNDAVVKATVTGTQLTLTPGKKGTATITLTAIDGGKRTTTTVQVRVTDKNAPDVHTIYPIPAHSYIKALMRSGVGKVQVIVTSLRGQKLIDETLTPDSRTREITLGIDRLAPGTYYLLLKTERITSKHTFIKK